ncbi:DUF1272 domain-containing protein [Rhodophyticola sp. SM2404]
MLLLKPNCECCDKDLPPSASDARICSYECTFCANCVDNHLGGACPNCGGNFVPRPIRSRENLVNSPASDSRVIGQQAVCVAVRGQS